VLEVEKDKWGYGNLGGMDDRGPEGPEFEARSAEDRGGIEARSTEEGRVWDGVTPPQENF
jgi:hypothetical protein